MNLQGRNRTSDPAEEPLSLTQAKSHLREDSDGQDSLIGDVLIPSARQWVEQKTWRALVTQTWEFTWYRFPTSKEISVPLPPLQSISSVKYFDTDNAEQTLDSSKYIVDTSYEPAVIRLKEGETWPDTYQRPGAVKVTAVVGYGAAGDVPARYKQAISLLVGHWYEHRENVVTGTISTRVQDTVEALLDLDHARAMIG